MILDIKQVGNPVLRQKARMLAKEEILSIQMQDLIYSMQETMQNAPGVGLAAPQIGESIQLVVLEDQAEYHRLATSAQLKERERVPVPFQVIINPVLSIEESHAVSFHEGCLSIRGLVGMVPRALSVKVSCLNERGESVTIQARGWYARILQHECDHLQGTLCIDRMDLRSLSTIENYQKYGQS